MSDKMQSRFATTPMGGLLVCVGLLAGCALSPRGYDDAENYGLGVAAVVRVAATQEEAAACLRRRQYAVSYPQGIGPGFSSIEMHGEALNLTQWFYLKRGATWATRFELLRADADSSDVKILLPAGLTAGLAYQRAAVELITLCGKELAHAGRAQDGERR
jgi:hypothetical protein